MTAPGADAPDVDAPPHPPLFATEALAREMHANLAVTFSTSASYALGSVRLERVGYANLPRLLLTVNCKSADLAGVIPICRQTAFSYLAERGVNHEHLAFRPSVATGSSLRKFTDQHGQSKMGESHEVSFDLSETLAAAVQWSWNGKGVLAAPWEA